MQTDIHVPLRPVDQDNGCTPFIRGTDAGEGLPHRSPDRVGAVECFEGFDVAQPIACSLAMRDCTARTGRTVHGDGASYSVAPYSAHVVVFERRPTPCLTPRRCPWQTDNVAPRIPRGRAWRRGGYLVPAWHRLCALGPGAQNGPTRARSGQPRP